MPVAARFFEEKIHAKEVLVEKLTLKNTTYKAAIQKLEAQLAHKEEMGEVRYMTSAASSPVGTPWSQLRRLYSQVVLWYCCSCQQFCSWRNLGGLGVGSWVM